MCIPEYDAKQRASDLAVLTRRRTQAELEEAQTSVQPADAGPSFEGPEPDEEPAGDLPVVGDGEDLAGTKKRKRLAKKLRKREERLAKAADAEEEDDAGAFDPTLLAVVGVLDEVKRQRNVAAWIRAGGLWGAAGDEPVGGEENDSGSDVVQGESRDAPVDGQDVTQGVSEGDAPAGIDEDGRDAGKRKRRRRRSRRRGDETRLDGTSNIAPGEEAVERPTSPSGNDQVSTDIKADAPDEDKDTVKVQPMWFEDPATLRYWVQRGRGALQELGLTAEHGIER